MRFLLTLLLLITISGASYCQPNNGANGVSAVLWQKNGIAVNDSQGRSVRQNPRETYLSDGTSVVVWEDERNGYTDIYAQRLSSDGKKLWGEQGVPVCTAGKNQTFPQVTRSGGAGVIITWQDYRKDSSDIYAQKLNERGEPLWPLNGVGVCVNQGNQISPQLCGNSKGGAIVTWYDYRSGKGEDIYAQQVGSSGSPEWTADGVPVCVESGTQWYPQIVADGKDGAVIIWDDKRSGYYDIYAQRMSGFGEAYWMENGIAVCAAPENQEYCQIASCEGDSFAVVWQDYRNNEADIYAQKISIAGKALWKTNGEIVCNVVGNQERPRLVGGPRPVVVWTDFRNGTGNSDIYCQKLSEAGKPVWDQFAIPVSISGGGQSDARIARDGSGGAVIIWQDRKGSAPSIMGRRINADGKAVWTAEGKMISAPNSAAEFPQIIYSDQGRVMIVWQDKRTGGMDVYAQSLDLLGGELWRNGGINIVSVFGNVTQQKPKIIRSGAGEYIIVFEDYRNGYSNIYAQKINNKGKFLWNRDGVRVSSFKSDQNNPDLASDGAGGAIIVWEDKRGNYKNVFSQRVDQYGNQLWDPGGIQVCQMSADQMEPKVCMDQNGGAFVSWLDNRKNEGSTSIYIQKIDRNGGLAWKADAIPVSASNGVQAQLKIVPDNSGGAIMTWVEYRKNVNVNTPDIFAQRIDAGGKLVWEQLGMGVCRAPEAQRNPDIAANDVVMIVWEDSGSGNYDIYAQKLNKDGTIAWECDGIPVCEASFTQHEPRVVHNEDGGATITWEDYRSSNWDVYAQRIDSNGGSLWEKDGIPVCTAKGTQYAPQIVKGKDMSTLVTWEDYRNGTSYNIFAQKISASGKLLWDGEGIPVCLTPGGGRNPQMVEDGEGGAVIVWTDYRYGNFDVYAQRINETSAK